MRLLFLIIALCAPLSAQLHFGLKGGVPLTDVTETVGNATVLKNLPSRWTLGPMIDLDLPAGLGIEFNMLYRRVGYEAPVRTSGLSSPANQTKEHTGGLWDFPLIAKYHFSGVLARPYVGAGYVYRHLNDLLSATSGSKGFVLSSGIRIGAPLMRIAPEIRYTRWDGPDIQPGFRTKKNQFEVLVGLSF